MRHLLRLTPAGLLGIGAAVLVSCGGSGKGLIPTAYAGPLQSDFQAVVRAAQEGNGNCSATEAAIRKTERDLRALPASVDGGLRGRLEEGVENLSARARTLCSQPLAQTTTTATTPTTTTPTTTTPVTPTTPGTEAPSEEEGGGTQAPREEGRGEEENEGGTGPGNGHGNGNGNGGEAGGATPGETGAGETGAGEVNGGTAGEK
jgi:hypothetical protein